MESVPPEPLDTLRRGYEDYLKRMRAGALEPEVPYLPYDFTRFLQRKWSLMGAVLIQGELSEMTNILNDWQNRLTKWHAWNCVLPNYNEQDAWGLRKEFLESDAHLCLFCPSAVRDAIAYVATNGIHQARLAAESGYRDFLKGDPELPGSRMKQYPRREREERLEALLSPWEAGATFMTKLRDLDNEAYRNETLDYRNEHSHAIGPNLAIGFTQFITRSVRQATWMVRQEDGRYRDELVPAAMQVSYSLGGRAPLDMEVSRKASLGQFQFARECFEIYVGILDVVRQNLPQTDSAP